MQSLKSVVINLCKEGTEGSKLLLGCWYFIVVAVGPVHIPSVQLS